MSKEASGNSNKLYVLIPTVSIVLLAGLALWVFSSSGRSGKFEFIVFEQTVVIEFAPDGESHTAALQRMMSDEALRQDLEGVLSKHDFHFVNGNNPNLVAGIREIAGDSDLAKAIRLFLKEQKNTFDPELHTFRDITQAKIVEEFNQLGHNHETVKRIRDAAYNDPRSVLFPAATAARFVIHGQVKEGVLGVCSGSDYKGESLNVFYNGESHAVTTFSLNCALTENEGSILVGNQEMNADFENFFVSPATAEKMFAGNEADSIEANVLLSRYMTQPVIPLSSFQLADATVE